MGESMSDPKKAVAAPAKPMNPLLRESLQPDKTQYRALVRFYGRMRRNRVYPLIVSLQKYSPGRGDGDTGGPVTVRPLVPGGEVTPAEQELDPTNSNAQATFYVVPVAKGKLGGARVQLLNKGSVVQEVRTPIRSVSQRQTLLFAILAIFLPFVIVDYLKFNPPSGTIQVKRMIPNPEKHPNPNALKIPRANAAGAPGGIPREAMDKMPDFVERVFTVPAEGGTLIAYQIKDNIPPTPVTDYVADNVQIGYDVVQRLTAKEGYYLGFYVFVILLAVTAVSWISNCSWRSRRRGAPMVLPN